MPAFVASLPLAGLPLGFRAGLATSLAAGLAFLLLAPLIDGPVQTALKGSGVALLALSAWQLKAPGARVLAAIMALGALGDVLLELPGLFIAGAASFAAGHAVAIAFYARHRRDAAVRDRLIAASLILYGLIMPPLLTPASQPWGLTMVYAVLLTGMAASLWLSRFPRLAALGAIAFVLSDTILVLRMGGGHLVGPVVDGALVWALYFGGQWLITLGVGRGLLARAARVA
ncbi:lysoplasmalogenase family protein [Sandarakinorhabdus oryzae]|uniref:lysoplasmalogenase family protein n=1 Tax=Sandarakinorhabdus oryzae TaxID=2675220 RepID=UPI0012E2972F|nr:lysoplasmalogenase family protein [Sandarakinorhabdus oryzae]